MPGSPTCPISSAATAPGRVPGCRPRRATPPAMSARRPRSAPATAKASSTPAPCSSTCASPRSGTASMRPTAMLMPMGQVRARLGRASPRPPDRRRVPLRRSLGGRHRLAARVGFRRRQPRRRDVRVVGRRSPGRHDAADAGLVVHRVDPLNCETSIPALIGGVVMPNARFYVRNHFATPTLDADDLAAGGRRSRRASVELEPARSAEHAVADAGRHARVRRQRSLDVQPAGRRRAVAPRRGEHRGVDRRAAGRGARPRRPTTGRAPRVVLRGADAGNVEGSTQPIHFERGLSLDDARDSEALLAYAMNGEPLPSSTATRCGSSSPAGTR